MAARRNIDCLRAIDRAWNERRWLDYGEFLSESLIAYANGDPVPHGKAEHLVRARSFCEAFPESVLHADRYLTLFASPDGNFTCSIVRLTGTAVCTMELPGGMAPVPFRRQFDITVVRVSEWQARKVIERRDYFDLELLERQIRRDCATPEDPKRATE
ncbi:MAG TPA: ester cyclase [Burkholderiaceae bacterium]|nr:ester cyclase [Burkholderiaceae bacterium]